MSGALRIFRYNWPIYVGTIGGALVLATMGGGLGKIGAGIAVGWAAWSLIVSYSIYDRSSLVSGTWIPPLLPSNVDAWASVDVGLDAEVMLDAVLPGRCLAYLDIYDGARAGAGSVDRARHLTPRAHAPIPCPLDALPLHDESCDLVAIVFSAHEVQRAEDRDRLFLEARRALRPKGRLLLVEHLRDLPNFLAFGPGFLHFKSRNEWLRVARSANLSVVMEKRVTPWVGIFVLEKTP